MNVEMDLWSDIYDQVYFDVNEDIGFYVQESILSDGPVLELGCGTGRVTFPIAKEGIDLLALDNSIGMLNVALEKMKHKGDSYTCLLYTSPSPRDGLLSRMPSSA